MCADDWFAGAGRARLNIRRWRQERRGALRHPATLDASSRRLAEDPRDADKANAARGKMEKFRSLWREIAGSMWLSGPICC